jgi:hypothetical protein
VVVSVGCAQAEREDGLETRLAAREGRLRFS